MWASSECMKIMGKARPRRDDPCLPARLNIAACRNHRAFCRAWGYARRGRATVSIGSCASAASRACASTRSRRQSFRRGRSKSVARHVGDAHSSPTRGNWHKDTRSDHDDFGAIRSKAIVISAVVTISGAGDSRRAGRPARAGAGATCPNTPVIIRR